MSALTFVVALVGGASARADEFAQLQSYLSLHSKSHSAFANISLSLGTSEGQVFSHVNGQMSMRTKRLLGSGSKWPAATALLSMMHQANAKLDDPISKYLTWWTTDTSDPRANATLRHFLSMTSGMVADGTDGALNLNCTMELKCPDAVRRKQHSLTAFAAFFGCAVPALNRTHAECVRLLYDASPALHAPGQYFMYGTLTFNFVGAAMEVALGKPIDVLLQEHFLRPLQFSGPWTSQGAPFEPAVLDNPVVPLLGGGLMADAIESERFLQRMLRMDFLPRALHEQQEDASAMPYSAYSTANAMYGPYGLGVWGECWYGGFATAYPAPCQSAHRITHPGCFGYWPFISRRDGYYFNFLPSYQCDLANNWCGSGKPLAGVETCSALGFAATVKSALQGLLDDVFVGGKLEWETRVVRDRGSSRA